MPNHPTGRCVPLGTRGIVAQSGTFGYELNPESLTPEERGAVQAQITDYHRYAALIASGAYYRLTEIGAGSDYESWMFVSPDGREALVNTVVTHQRANGPFIRIRLRGLKPDAVYSLEGTGERFTGAALMEGGYAFPPFWGDYPSQQLHLVCEAAAGTKSAR
jgi:alpha-galactosidase